MNVTLELVKKVVASNGNILLKLVHKTSKTSVLGESTQKKTYYHWVSSTPLAEGSTVTVDLDQFEQIPEEFESPNGEIINLTYLRAK